MPIFNKYVDARLARKQIDSANHAIANSVMGKAVGMDKVNTADGHIKYAKSQKKDSLYVRCLVSIRFIFHLDFAITTTFLWDQQRT